MTDGEHLDLFIDENLSKSKDELKSFIRNEGDLSIKAAFMQGWIAALMHVKVNFLNKQTSTI